MTSISLVAVYHPLSPIVRNGQRSSTTRMRLAGKICCFCGRYLGANALATAWRVASRIICRISALAGTDDEDIAGGFNDRSRDDMKVIHAENSLDLSEEPRQKPEISADHPNVASYHFRNELLVRGGQR